MQPKISVIVPIYKAEKYLHRCIDSILAQTFTDFELILVNDGSPDNCGAICDEYAAKDSRIQVLHKVNGGVTAARADGVKHSNGEWITFVDADDTLPIKALETYNTNISNDFDIIRGDVNIPGYNPEFKFQSGIFSCKDYRSEIINQKKLPAGPWSILIRKSLFTENTFNIPRELVFGEDKIMNIRLAFENKKNVYVISEPVYNYILNNDSCVHTFNKTFEYIKKWYSYINSSIPENQKDFHIYDCIEFRLSFLIFLRKYYIKNNIWRKDTFHKELLHDIKRSKYKLSRLDRFTISFSSPITNALYIFISKIYSSIQRSMLKR